MNESAGEPQRSDGSSEALLMTLWDDGEAEMIRQILLDYEIPARVESDLLHALFPLSVDGLGEVRIFVPEEKLEDAKEILAEHRRRGLEIVVGGENAREGSDPEEPTGEDRER